MCLSKESWILSGLKDFYVREVYALKYFRTCCRVVADMAAKQACGEITVRNIVDASPATDVTVASNLAGVHSNAHDSTSDSSSGVVSGNGFISSNTSDNDNTESTPHTAPNSSGSAAMGKLVCRKRKPMDSEGSAQGQTSSHEDQALTVDGRVVEGHAVGDGQPVKKARVAAESSDKGSPPYSSYATNLNDSASSSVSAASSASVPVSTLSSSENSDESTNIIVRNSFGSEVLKISFTNEMWDRLLVHLEIVSDDVPPSKSEAYSEQEVASYGVKYNFALKDKSNEAAVDAPEWLVPQVSER